MSYLQADLLGVLIVAGMAFAIVHFYRKKEQG